MHVDSWLLIEATMTGSRGWTSPRNCPLAAIVEKDIDRRRWVSNTYRYDLIACHQSVDYPNLLGCTDLIQIHDALYKSAVQRGSSLLPATCRNKDWPAASRIAGQEGSTTTRTARRSARPSFRSLFLGANTGMTHRRLDLPVRRFVAPTLQIWKLELVPL